MNLNRLHSGKKLLTHMIEKGNLTRMGWTQVQREEQLNNKPNPHTKESRKK